MSWVELWYTRKDENWKLLTIPECGAASRDHFVGRGWDTVPQTRSTRSDFTRARKLVVPVQHPDP